MGEVTDTMRVPMISVQNVCLRTCVYHVFCVHTSNWGVIAGSLLVWESHTSCSFPTPCQGQDPLTATALLCFFHVCQTRRLNAHAQVGTQMLSACYHLFRHLSLPSETEFVNSLPTTYMESAHFHSPISNQSTCFPIKFLKQLFLLSAGEQGLGSAAAQERFYHSVRSWRVADSFY